jgi:hypothetical protein
MRRLSLATLAAFAFLLMSGGVEHERALLGPSGAAIKALETEAAEGTSAHAVLELARGYLTMGHPGMAISAIEGAAPPVREVPLVRDLYARALVAQGRASGALKVDRAQLRYCHTYSCESWLVASAVRRATLMEALVARGVQDEQADPEDGWVVYRQSGRVVGVGP